MSNNVVQTDKARLRSIDALRGFDMFWIMGIGGVIVHLSVVEQTPFMSVLASQFVHPYWDGFTLWDMIFPLFMFLSGMSSSFSIDKQLNKGRTRKQILWRVVKRGVLLVLLGILHNTKSEFHAIPLKVNNFSRIIRRNFSIYVY